MEILHNRCKRNYWVKVTFLTVPNIISMLRQVGAAIYQGTAVWGHLQRDVWVWLRKVNKSSSREATHYTLNVSLATTFEP